MDFLKEVLGDELFKQFAAKMKDSKIKLADLGTGNYVDKHKFDTQATALTTAQGQIKEANKQIEDFKGMDIETIKKNAEDYKIKFEDSEKTHKTEIEDAEKTYNAKILDMQFNTALDGALTGTKAKNIKAVKALLKMDEIKLDGDKLMGFDTQMEAIKKENDFLFEPAKDDYVPPNFTQQHQQTPPPGGAEMKMNFTGVRPQPKQE